LTLTLIFVADEVWKIDPGQSRFTASAKLPSRPGRDILRGRHSPETVEKN
jgi:hypothetical protein